MKSWDKKRWIMTALRRVSYRYPPRNAAKISARKERGKYECSLCHKLFGPKEIQLDHIVPVIDTEKGFTDWNDYVERLFCDYGGYQVCCLDCHASKTKDENEIRRENKALTKSSKSDKIKE